MYMTQNMQSELDTAEEVAANETELVDIDGFSQHDGFMEESDESITTDCTPPTNMFRISERALRHQKRTRTQDALEKLSQKIPLRRKLVLVILFMMTDRMTYLRNLLTQSTLSTLANTSTPWRATTLLPPSPLPPEAPPRVYC